jgi:nicotinamidase-related amidase
MYRSDQLDVDQAMVLVVDIQAKLLPLIHKRKRIIAMTQSLLDGAKLFDLPVIATEQYPKGIGATVGEVAEKLTACDAKTVEKSTFSVWGQQAARDAIITANRQQVLVCGIEAHVCVQQTVLDLLSRDYMVFVLSDAIGSRGKVAYKTAITRMTQAGAFVTTVESALFELCNRCDAEKFKGLLEIVKQFPPD